MARSSAHFPGLTLDVQKSDRGLILTFRGPGCWSSYQVSGGEYHQVDCSESGRWTAAIADHIRAVLTRCAKSQGGSR